jgi:hypothetical protein
MVLMAPGVLLALPVTLVALALPDLPDLRALMALKDPLVLPELTVMTVVVF